MAPCTHVPSAAVCHAIPKAIGVAVGFASKLHCSLCHDGRANERADRASLPADAAGFTWEQQLLICLHCCTITCFPQHTHEHAHAHEEPLGEAAEGQGHNFFISADNLACYCAACRDYVYHDLIEHIIEKTRVLGVAGCIDYLHGPSNPLDLMEQFVPLNSHSYFGLGLRGLSNLGNTCFVSVILQAFIHNPYMREYFLSRHHINTTRYHQTLPDGITSSSKDDEVLATADDGHPAHCMGCAMTDLFSEMFNGVREEYSPTEIVYAVWMNSKHLAGYAQQDSHEFFIALINTLHTHLLPADSAAFFEHAGRDCPCVAHQVFSGSLCSDVVCCDCGNTSSTYEPFYDISLSLRNVDHLPPAFSSRPAAPTKFYCPSKPVAVSTALMAPPATDSLSHSEINAMPTTEASLRDPESTAAPTTGDVTLITSSQDAGQDSEREQDHGVASVSDTHALERQNTPLGTTTSFPTPQAPAPTIEQCLQAYTSPETLGDDALIYCPNCNTKTNAQKKFSIAHLPRVVCVHLKRFEHVPYLHKLNTFIKFDENLDLGPFMQDGDGKHVLSPDTRMGSSQHSTNDAEFDDDEDLFDDVSSPESVDSVEGRRHASAPFSPPFVQRKGSLPATRGSHEMDNTGSRDTFNNSSDSRVLYSLFCVVVHVGSIDTGHYICYVRMLHDDEHWYCIDDNIITAASREEVLSAQAYMLFYVCDAARQ